MSSSSDYLKTQSADEFGEALPLMRISTNLFDKLDNISNDLPDELRSDNSDDNIFGKNILDQEEESMESPDLPKLSKSEFS